MPETTQQPARDWQDDWMLVKNLELETLRSREPGVIYLSAEREEERLGYWLQQYRIKAECYDELKEQLARINCDYHALKANFLKLREECGAEKKRADEVKDIILDAIGTLAMRGNKEDADRIADKLRNVGADKL
ncbi:hypothetical protein M5X00_31215 [Paenibacillus alvei]|uniref:Uncharacterized protein n=1 Tax=Paenibacillus alvei TaxID=44250 RepID=A0ABT4H7R1_PAEAL|nr:hypothetical protein [Paenibacillus alvei]EJW14237.1 hypothetical protein PAV_15c00260 [Paenibacillus alvei DSM 29]MCY9704188.1 hypothetical protein [Paenibacillus alvei]MCY9737995.1 hypothetical protein [Paenibacillus alvei]MCY9758691.1 hypothetical protein [Paenibacillus alvei]MCY9765005.1 hypothetical protein [Paenibacillus alvei]